MELEMHKVPFRHVTQSFGPLNPVDLSICSCESPCKGTNTTSLSCIKGTTDKHIQRLLVWVRTAWISCANLCRLVGRGSHLWVNKGVNHIQLEEVDLGISYAQLFNSYALLPSFSILTFPVLRLSPAKYLTYVWSDPLMTRQPTRR